MSTPHGVLGGFPWFCGRLQFQMAVLPSLPRDGFGSLAKTRMLKTGDGATESRRRPRFVKPADVYRGRVTKCRVLCTMKGEKTGSLACLDACSIVFLSDTRRCFFPTFRAHKAKPRNENAPAKGRLLLYVGWMAVGVSCRTRRAACPKGYPQRFRRCCCPPVSSHCETRAR